MASRKPTALIRPSLQPEVVDQAPAHLEDPGFDDYGAIVSSNLDASPPSFITPLTAKEKKRLNELEGLIKKHFSEWLAVCFALREIRDNLYYRATHRTFSAYCKDTLEMARSRAYQLIGSADVVDNLKELNLSTACRQNVHNGRQIELIPQNEGQARTLSKYPPEQQREIWAEAIQTAPDGKITAAHIKKTARRLHSENVKKAVSKTRQQTNQAPKIGEDFRRAFNNFLDAINIERANQYRNTDQKEVLRHVRIIWEALEAEL